MSNDNSLDTAVDAVLVTVESVDVAAEVFETANIWFYILPYDLDNDNFELDEIVSELKSILAEANTRFRINNWENLEGLVFNVFIYKNEEKYLIGFDEFITTEKELTSDCVTNDTILLSPYVYSADGVRTDKTVYEDVLQ